MIDVAIVGDGPAGSYCAYYLAKEGIPSQHIRIMHSGQVQCAGEPRLCSMDAETRVKVFASTEAMVCNSSFEMLLAEAVGEVLSSLEGASEQIIYSHLEKAFNIKKQDIPYKIDEFANAIEKIFGVGAKLLEIRIMKLIYEKIAPSYKHFRRRKDLIFAEYVNAARAEFDERSRNARAEADRLPSNTRILGWKEQILKLA